MRVRLGGIATRVALLSLLVTAVAVVVIAIGVLVVAVGIQPAHGSGGPICGDRSRHV